MWPATNLVNRRVFMELGKSETDWGVLRTEGVQNGVGSGLKGRNTSKKTMEKGGEMKKRRNEKGGKIKG